MSEISIKQCRDLRMYIDEFTSGCLLTQDEYNDIISVLVRAVERLEKEGMVRDGKSNINT